jgi:SnoaL-like protein
MDERAVADLIAKQAIAELIHTYPRGLDRLDRDILLSIGHPTATVEFSTLFKGAWAGYVDWLMQAHHAMIFNNHRISNMLIRVNADRAASETTSTATLIAKRDDGAIEDRLVYSRYLDQWRRDNGRWSLSHRLTVRDFRRVKVITADELKSYQYTNASEVGRNDPSYGHFAEIG